MGTKGWPGGIVLVVNAPAEVVVFYAYRCGVGHIGHGQWGAKFCSSNRSEVIINMNGPTITAHAVATYDELLKEVQELAESIQETAGDLMAELHLNNDYNQRLDDIRDSADSIVGIALCQLPAFGSKER